MRGLKSKKKRSQKSGVSSMAQVKKFRRNVLSLPQLLSKLRQQRTRPSMSSPSKGQSQISGQRSSTNQRRDAQQKKLQFGSQVNQPFSSLAQQNRKKTVKPIIPPKTLVIILKEKPTKQVYNRRIIDYKHSGLLQRYIGLGGKILPRRQTRLTAKQQRFIAKTIKTARVMGLLPFVSKERGFFK